MSDDPFIPASAYDQSGANNKGKTPLGAPVPEEVPQPTIEENLDHTPESGPGTSEVVDPPPVESNLDQTPS